MKTKRSRRQKRSLRSLGQEEQDNSGSDKEEGEVEDEPDPWRPLLQKVWEDLKEPYLKEV